MCDIEKTEHKMFTTKSQLRRAHKAISKIQDPEALRKVCHMYADKIFVADNLIETLAKLNEDIVNVIIESQKLQAGKDVETETTVENFISGTIKFPPWNKRKPKCNCTNHAICDRDFDIDKFYNRRKY